MCQQVRDAPRLKQKVSPRERWKKTSNVDLTYTTCTKTWGRLKSSNEAKRSACKCNNGTRLERSTVIRRDRTEGFRRERCVTDTTLPEAPQVELKRMSQSKHTFCKKKKKRTRK